jgi:hypothetical protein
MPTGISEILRSAGPSKHCDVFLAFYCTFKNLRNRTLITKSLASIRAVINLPGVRCNVVSALPEERCTGQNFYVLRDFCAKRGLSLSQHGRSIARREGYYQVFMFAEEAHADLFCKEFDGERMHVSDRGSINGRNLALSANLSPRVSFNTTGLAWPRSESSKSGRGYAFKGSRVWQPNSRLKSTRIYSGKRRVALKVRTSFPGMPPRSS